MLPFRFVSKCNEGTVEIMKVKLANSGGKELGKVVFKWTPPKDKLVRWLTEKGKVSAELDCGQPVTIHGLIHSSDRYDYPTMFTRGVDIPNALRNEIAKVGFQFLQEQMQLGPR